jgi:hypothetical protein
MDKMGKDAFFPYEPFFRLLFFSHTQVPCALYAIVHVAYMRAYCRRIKIFSSPMTRACQTAEAVSRGMNAVSS